MQYCITTKHCTKALQHIKDSNSYKSSLPISYFYKATLEDTLHAFAAVLVLHSTRQYNRITWSASCLHSFPASMHHCLSQYNLDHENLILVISAEWWELLQQFNWSKINKIPFGFSCIFIVLVHVWFWHEQICMETIRRTTKEDNNACTVPQTFRSAHKDLRYYYMCNKARYNTIILILGHVLFASTRTIIHQVLNIRSPWRCCPAK